MRRSHGKNRDEVYDRWLGRQDIFDIVQDPMEEEEEEENDDVLGLVGIENRQPEECRNNDDDTSLFTKTGTTIVGIVSADGTKCVMAADSRSTCSDGSSGLLVADKEVNKVHELMSSIGCFACGAGTSGDIDALIRKVHYTFLLLKHQQNDDNDDTIYFPAILGLLRNELYSAKATLGVNLILSGLYNHKFHLVALHPHGSIDTPLPFAALGSGSLAAISILETAHTKVNNDKDALLQTAIRAVRAGIDNDLASGNSITIIYMEYDTDTNQLIIQPQTHTISSPPNTNDSSLHSSSNNEIIQPSSLPLTRRGVNGFGSLNFQIRNKQLILQDEQSVQQKHTQWFQNKLNP